MGRGSQHDHGVALDGMSAEEDGSRTPVNGDRHSRSRGGRRSSATTKLGVGRASVGRPSGMEKRRRGSSGRRMSSEGVIADALAGAYDPPEALRRDSQEGYDGVEADITHDITYQLLQLPPLEPPREVPTTWTNNIRSHRRSSGGSSKQGTSTPRQSLRMHTYPNVSSPPPGRKGPAKHGRTRLEKLSFVSSEAMLEHVRDPAEMDVRLKEAMLEEEEELREMHSRLSRNPLRTFPNPDHLRMTAAELDVGANIQSARGEYLGVINRKARYVGGNSGGRLQQRIVQGPNVDLSHMRWTVAHANAVTECLASHLGLRRLVLMNCVIDDRGVSVLCETLGALVSKGAGCMHLDLSNNALGHAGADHLSRLIASQSKLKAHCHDEVSEADGQVTRVVAHGSSEQRTLFYPLRTLVLDGNKLGDRGAGYLAAVISDNERDDTSMLEELSLANCSIQDKGGVILGDSLGNNTQLKKLNLSWNQLGLGRAATQIAGGLGVNTTLKILNVGHCGLGLKEESGEAIAEALRLNRVLADLDVSHNALKPAACSAIGRATETSPALKSLSMAHNPLGHEAATTLLGAVVSSASSLEKADLTACSFLESRFLEMTGGGDGGLGGGEAFFSPRFQHARGSHVAVAISPHAPFTPRAQKGVESPRVSSSRKTAGGADGAAGAGTITPRAKAPKEQFRRMSGVIKKMQLGAASSIVPMGAGAGSLLSPTGPRANADPWSAANDLDSLLSPEARASFHRMAIYACVTEFLRRVPEAWKRTLTEVHPHPFVSVDPISDTQFHNLWGTVGGSSVDSTDEWRHKYLEVLVRVANLTSEHAGSVVSSIATHQARAVNLLVDNVSDPDKLFNLARIVQPGIWEQLLVNRGVIWRFNPQNLEGRYVLHLSRREDRMIAGHLRQEFMRQRSARLFTSTYDTAWRNAHLLPDTAHIGGLYKLSFREKEVSAEQLQNPRWTLPNEGWMILDFVSFTRRIPEDATPLDDVSFYYVARIMELAAAPPDPKTGLRGAERCAATLDSWAECPAPLKPVVRDLIKIAISRVTEAACEDLAEELMYRRQTHQRITPTETLEVVLREVALTLMARLCRLRPLRGKAGASRQWGECGRFMAPRMMKRRYVQPGEVICGAKQGYLLTHTFWIESGEASMRIKVHSEEMKNVPFGTEDGESSAETSRTTTPPALKEEVKLGEGDNEDGNFAGEEVDAEEVREVVVGEGDICGLVPAVVGSAHWPCTVVATTPCVVVSIPPAELKALGEGHNPLAQRLETARKLYGRARPITPLEGSLGEGFADANAMQWADWGEAISGDEVISWEDKAPTSFAAMVKEKGPAALPGVPLQVGGGGGRKRTWKRFTSTMIMTQKVSGALRSFQDEREFLHNRARRDFLRKQGLLEDPAASAEGGGGGGGDIGASRGSSAGSEGKRGSTGDAPIDIRVPEWWDQECERGPDDEQPLVGGGEAGEGIGDGVYEVVRALSCNVVINTRQLFYLLQLDLGWGARGRVETVVALASSLIDGESITTVLRTLSPGEQAMAGERLGWMNIINTGQPSMHYTLRMNVHEEREAARRLCHLAARSRIPGHAIPRCFHNLMVNNKRVLVESVTGMWVYLSTCDDNVIEFDFTLSGEHFVLATVVGVQATWRATIANRYMQRYRGEQGRARVMMLIKMQAKIRAFLAKVRFERLKRVKYAEYQMRRMTRDEVPG